MSTSADKAKPALSYGEMREKLGPDDVDGKVAPLTCATAERKNFAPNGQGEEYKIVLTFEEFPEKELVVNATSYKTLVAKLGDDEDAWVGKTIVLAPTTTTYGGKSYEKLHVASPERWDKTMVQLRKRN